MPISRELALSISEELKEIANVFQSAQTKSTLLCPTGCGGCCFKSDISCAPIELLPMAYHLVDSGRGEEFIEKARAHTASHCLFLEVTDEKTLKGRCLEYDHRPFLCRAFGLAARSGKGEQLDYSVCKILRQKLEETLNLKLSDLDLPLIDVYKRQLESLDPAFMEKEVPINVGLLDMLEKILLIERYASKSSP